MLNEKGVVARFILFQSYLIIVLVMFPAKSIMGQKNFNGGFEIKSLSQNEPVGWFATRVPQTKDFVVFAWDSTEYHSGSHSVSIAIDSTHSQDVIAYNWTRTYADFTIDSEYLLSGWVKTNNLKKPTWIVVQCWDENNKMVGFFTTQRTYQIQGTTNWTEVKTDFTVPEGTKEVRIRAGITSPENNGGKVWFDDIKIE
jgi:hypothetical protein